MAEIESTSHRIEVVPSKKPYEERLEKIPYGGSLVEAPSTTDFAKFKTHPWVMLAVYKDYQRETIIAEQAMKTVVSHLNRFNEEHKERNSGQVLFTTLEGRVKKADSYLRKLFCVYEETTQKKGMTRDIFSECVREIHDILGVRFAVPYYDEIVRTIKDVVRPKLQKLHYAVDLNGEGLQDKDYLDKGDENGYRSYHFFVKVPTCVDLYGQQVLYLCEIQARSELQHVWAVKSHDLFYEGSSPCIPADDKNLNEDMKQISNQLRAIDQLLVSIRDRVRGENRL